MRKEPYSGMMGLKERFGTGREWPGQMTGALVAAAITDENGWVTVSQISQPLTRSARQNMELPCDPVTLSLGPDS